MALTYVNQVGASDGMNQAAPGSFIPESYVRWSQDILFDRVGYLRRRSPYSTLDLYNATGTALAQPDLDGARVIGVVNTRNLENENRIGIVVTDGSTTRILFYDEEYRKTCYCTLDAVRQDTVMFSRPALGGGVFIGFLENYGIASAQNKNLLYYWRGGAGEGDYEVSSVSFGLRNDTPFTGSATISNDKITVTNHGFPNGYELEFTSLGSITGLSLNTTYYIVNAGTNDFQVAATPGGTYINFGNADSTVSMLIPGHVKYNNQISGTFDTTKITSGMFVYRVDGSNEYYLGTVKTATSSTITLEKDIIRTFGYEESAYNSDNNSGLTVKFVNVRPYIHNHGRGLITRSEHGFTVTSGVIGSEGEGHFASADLGGAESGTKWALYRASDGMWIGDVKEATNNTTIALSDNYHANDLAMNADEYVARAYAPISMTNDATEYTGCFNTTYAGYQWYGNGGSLGTENRIVFSAYHDPESVDLSKDAADSIIMPGTQQMRGMASSASGLIIFLEDKTYILRGNYRTNFSLEELYPEGCLSAQSIVEYGGGVFWASKNGILYFDGATVRNLTETNLGAYYTDSIKTFDATLSRIYGFFYKDYLFMTFTGFASNYTPLRYEPVYADGIETTPAIQNFAADDWDPDFTPDDFRIENNVPIYWKSHNMYSSEGSSIAKSTGTWAAGVSYPGATLVSGDATVTGLTGIVDPDDVGKTIIGFGIPAGTTVASVTSATEIEMSAAATEDFDPATDGTASFQILPTVSTGNTWGKDLQFVWGPVNLIESMTFAIYLPTNATTAISNFDFRGFIKLDSAGGTKGYAGINAVNPDATTGTYARLIDVDSMLDPSNKHTHSLDSELSENTGKNPDLYYKGPDFYLQTKHYTVGDPVIRKWFRHIMLNLYQLDGGVRLDVVDMEDNDRIDVQKKRHKNWELFEEKGYSWTEFLQIILPRLLSPNRSTWGNIESLNKSWYTISDAEFTRRSKKISWRYPSAGFRLYQMNDYRPSNYQSAKRPHTIMIDSWNIGFKPMRSSRV